VEAALNMIVSGETVMSEMLAMPGQKLFNKMSASAETLLAEAKALAVRPLPRVRDLSCKHPRARLLRVCRHHGAGMSKNFPAPMRCVEAVKNATTKKFDDGMVAEREAFMQLMMTPESRALRHLFLAERAASKIPDVPAIRRCARSRPWA
jgi:3-hydroxyacyl-CoA dehydrogenase